MLFCGLDWEDYMEHSELYQEFWVQRKAKNPRTLDSKHSAELNHRPNFAKVYRVHRRVSLERSCSLFILSSKQKAAQNTENGHQVTPVCFLKRTHQNSPSRPSLLLPLPLPSARGGCFGGGGLGGCFGGGRREGGSAGSGGGARSPLVRSPLVSSVRCSLGSLGPCSAQAVSKPVFDAWMSWAPWPDFAKSTTWS